MHPTYIPTSAIRMRIQPGSLADLCLYLSLALLLVCLFEQSTRGPKLAGMNSLGVRIWARDTSKGYSVTIKEPCLHTMQPLLRRIRLYHPSLCKSNASQLALLSLQPLTNHRCDGGRILRDPRLGVTISCRIRAITRTERSPGRFTKRVRVRVSCLWWQIQGILHLLLRRSMYRISIYSQAH
ncbi:hypothetical protein HDV64DRAFT_256536 [Trichoderma sp. TUCIM 5745]